MLENYTGSPDVAFSRDIHTIAASAEAIAHSVSVIAGILAKREGIPCTDPSLALKAEHLRSPQQQPTPEKADALQLETSIQSTYDDLL